MTGFLVFLVFVLLYLALIAKSGNTFPILYLFLFTYFLQYIFSTYLIYYAYDELRVEMEIPATQYFDYAVPALLALFAGVFVFNRDVSLNHSIKHIDSEAASKFGYLLLFVSYGFDLVPALGIPSINSLLSFTGFLKYLAAFCFLFTRSRINYVIIGLVYLQLATNALQAGVFIDFFIWSTFLFFFICLRFEFPFWLRASFIVLAAPLLVIIQSIKTEYRYATWVKKQQGGIGLFSELAQKGENLNEPFTESEGFVRTVARLSQGWHLGLTLKHVPSKEPFANGEDMLGDVAASILPRVIFTEKKIVGSQSKFYKYTGHRLRGNTSMTIGVLGDFFVNYGVVGSFIMLFAFGGLIARMLYYFMTRFVESDPINIIWVPFMLSYLCRANNDFYIVINCLIKGFLMFLFINYVRKQLWPEQRPKPVLV